MGDPLFRAQECLWIDGAGADASDFLGSDETALLENLKMLQDRRQRHLERLGQLAHRRRAAAQMLHHTPPGRISEGVKHTIQITGIVKHATNLCIGVCATQWLCDRLSIPTVVLGDALSRCAQRLLEIGKDVVDMLDTDRQANVPIRNACRAQLLRRKLRMGGRGWVNGETARVADVGHVVEQFERIDKATARIASLRQLESDEPPWPPFRYLSARWR